MYLFGWRKRTALILCSFLFLGSISYLSGTISHENIFSPKDNKTSSSFLSKNFLEGSLPLKLFNGIFSISLQKGEKNNIVKTTSKLTSSLERDNLLSQTKEIIRSKILKRLSLLKPEVKFEQKDLLGNIFYKWINENMIWVIVKFKSTLFDSQNWFYDNFSVIVNK
ncbi:hypothetical protein MSUIS_07840 [Mycoplasma suis KI3806]|uniref:Uncharacterized protein n=1 Tax=Mycoplasma suis (strain KI_3806) TaxID=708248 RepID=F0V2J6_MYCS3|nr:hypothetical protein [Mycoplasma suis]CBZ40877.1 hypothetical protein MSUIS_07840 [Mycoplasma suis KI3806]